MEHEMTNAERRTLCAQLRDGSIRNMPKWAANACSRAADEIERLAGENDWARTALRAAQSGTELPREVYDKTKGHAVTQNNYDTSTGLIEVSCLLDKRADDFTGRNEKIEQGYRMAAKYLRARAADRSWK
jgi:hypothetical protein